MVAELNVDDAFLLCPRARTLCYLLNGDAGWLGPAGTRTIGAIPMIHRQNFIFKKTRTSRLIELIENSIEFVEISIESIESVESIFTRKSSS